jgi:hypothetical protein
VLRPLTAFQEAGSHPNFNTPNYSIILFTPNVVLDSQDHQGLPVTLAKSTGSSSNIQISQVQFLECTKSLVDQSGTVDTEFRTLNEASLQPNIFKTNSTWTASTSMILGPQDSTLLGGDLVCQAIELVHINTDWVVVAQDSNSILHWRHDSGYNQCWWVGIITSSICQLVNCLLLDFSWDILISTPFQI